jgi:hypothetical protein
MSMYINLKIYMGMDMDMDMNMNTHMVMNMLHHFRVFKSGRKLLIHRFKFEKSK